MSLGKIRGIFTNINFNFTISIEIYVGSFKNLKKNIQMYFYQKIKSALNIRENFKENYNQ